MELTNEIRVDVPVDEAWDVLTDLERIAPCLPGAQLLEVEGEEYRGVVKVKVGPITAQYKGVAKFLEKDPVAKRGVISAEGRDTRGQGNANATITATLEPDGTGSLLKVVTDLTVTGKVAQFGRGVLADVSTKLMGQFADNLHKDLLSGSTTATPPAAASADQPAPAPAPTAAASGPSSSPRPATTTTAAPTAAPPASNGSSTATPAASGVRKIDSKPVEPVDLLDAAGVPVVKRAIPLVAGIMVIAWYLRRRRRRRG